MHAEFVDKMGHNAKLQSVLFIYSDGDKISYENYLQEAMLELFDWHIYFFIHDHYIIRNVFFWVIFKK